VIGFDVIGRRVIIRDPYEMIRGYKKVVMVVIVFGSLVER